MRISLSTAGVLLALCHTVPAFAQGEPAPEPDPDRARSSGRGSSRRSSCGSCSLTRAGTPAVGPRAPAAA